MNSYLDKSIELNFVEFSVAELAIAFARRALLARVVELTREVVVHVQAFVSLRTTVVHVEFAQFHLSQGHGIVRILTVFCTLKQQFCT